MVRGLLANMAARVGAVGSPPRAEDGGRAMSDVPPGASRPPDPKGGDRVARIAALLAELRRQGIGDERVLATLARVPRERFVPPAMQADAWANIALPIGSGQSISQPYVVAVMTAALALAGGERVLEIGTGSGYQTAILADLVGPRGFVVSIERHAPLAARAAAVLADLGFANATVHVGDGSTGWPAAAPYDRIIVTAAGPDVPAPLLEQLDPAAGRLVMPVGRHDEAQELIVVDRRGDELRQRTLGPVRFVPLVGRHGWQR
jgi:protein-L-isoaspartate(D-aspartate) O-methyltransferase